MVGIVNDVMDKKIQEAKDASGELIVDITESVKAELGIDTIDHQIATLESQIDTLKEKRKKLGVSEFGRLIDGSKAQALIDERLEKRVSIRSLEREKAKILSAIWTTTSLSKAKELATSVLD